MSPALDMPLNRREAVTSLLAMLAFAIGATPIAAEEREIPLEATRANGIPEESPALFAAGLVASVIESDDENWRQALRDANYLAERMSQAELRAIQKDIRDRAEPLKCPTCRGMGFDVIVTGQYPYQERTYPNCKRCNGTGRKDGGQ